MAAGAALGRRGLVRGREGNISCRLDDASFLLTPRSADVSRLAGPELVRCKSAGDKPAQASSEIAVHAAIFATAPEIRAIVHAHPASALALSLRSKPPDPQLLLEGEALVGRVATVPAWAPGSRRLAEACADAVRLATVVILARHGALAVGKSVGEAVLRLEIVELAAAVALAGSDHRQ